MSNAPMDGRGRFPAPISGGIMLFPLSISDLADSETAIFRYKAPCAMVIDETDVVANVHTTGGGSVTYAISNGVAGGTDVVAARNIPASDTHETLTPTSATALAERTFSKGDVLTITLTSAGATSSLADFTALVTAYQTDHVAARPDSTSVNDPM